MEAPTAEVPVDPSDPAVVLAAWLIMAGIKRWAPDAIAARLRPWIPLCAVIVAVFVRAGIDAAEGADLSTVEAWGAVLLRGGAAGAAAVWSHSQIREAAKSTIEAEKPVDPTIGARRTP